jgi:hypothetical protein
MNMAAFFPIFRRQQVDGLQVHRGACLLSGLSCGQIRKYTAGVTADELGL